MVGRKRAIILTKKENKQFERITSKEHELNTTMEKRIRGGLEGELS